MTDEDGLESPPEWLMIERPEHEKEPAMFLLTMLRKAMPRKAIVRLVMERYRTERIDEEMKWELGLDHFEGRSHGGWHPHVSVALCCHATSISIPRGMLEASRSKPRHSSVSCTVDGATVDPWGVDDAPGRQLSRSGGAAPRFRQQGLRPPTDPPCSEPVNPLNVFW